MLSLKPNRATVFSHIRPIGICKQNNVKQLKLRSNAVMSKRVYNKMTDTKQRGAHV